MLKKINNYHLFLLIIIVFILNTILFRSIDITKAQWTSPDQPPGVATGNIVTSPLSANLDVNNNSIFNVQNLDVNNSIKFSNANNRLYFGEKRALEGSLDGSLLQVGEYYSNTMLYGKVGIGNSNPIETLYVDAGSKGDGILWGLGVKNIHNEDTDTEYGVGIKLRGGSDSRDGNEDNKWSGIAAVNSGGWANSQDLVFYVDENERVRISNNGHLTASGNITASGFLYSSDKTLKKNIKSITNPLERIIQLEGVSFNWKKDNQESIGLIAQDVEKVFPELVSTNKEGLKTVAYGNLIAPLIEALKIQDNKIEQLIKEIKQLKNEQSY